MAASVAALAAATLVQLGPPESAITEHDQQISMRDGFKSTIKVHKPSSPPAAGSPLIVLIYGGGFIAGNKDSFTGLARALVRLVGAVVVNISYRLAPEHKFPKAPEDAWDSVKWLTEHASELGANPELGFIVGGASAGGNLTAVVTTLAIEEKLSPPITGQWLAVPVIMEPHHLPEKYKRYYLAHEHNAHAPILDVAALAALGRHVEWDTESPLRDPILSKAPLEALPPTYFQVDGMDPLRDDGLIYEEMLKEAGVRTKIDFYPGCPHAHFMFVYHQFGHVRHSLTYSVVCRLMPGMEISNKAWGDVFAGFGWLLSKKISAKEGLRAMAPSF